MDLKIPPPHKKQKIHKNPKKGIAVRLAAVKILTAIHKQKLSLDGLLDKKTGHQLFRNLNDNDQALCRAILTTTLTHHMAIERQLEEYLKKKLPPNADALRFLLYTAIAQILYLNVPTYAAIDSAAEIARNDPRLTRFKGLINAVLRKFSLEGEKFPFEQNPLQQTPSWLINILKENYDKKTIKKILEIQNTKAPLDITVKENVPYWAEKLNALPLLGNSLRLRNQNTTITQLPGFTEGAWWVQNVASSIPAQLIPAPKEKKIADLCAAPGGKTAQLLCYGAQVTAIDKIENRYQRLKENLKRLKLTAEIKLMDFRAYTPKNNFDAVLLDAPCSSTGTIRRHKDILWTKSQALIQELADLQYKLLYAAIDLVKPNGTIVFSNCSLAAAEGEMVIEKILQNRNDIIISPLTIKEFPQFGPLLTQKGYIRTHPAHMPHENPLLAGMDGFFAARLIKKKNI